MKFKKVLYEEPLTEGKVPKSYARFHGEIYEIIPDEWDIDTYDPGEHETETYIINDKEEFYNYTTKCKACGTEFIAYDAGELVRDYCPGCGERLVGIAKPRTSENGKLCGYCAGVVKYNHKYCPWCGEKIQEVK